MRKYSFFIMGISLGVIFTLALLWRGLANKAQAQAGDATPQVAGRSSDAGAAQSGLLFNADDETMPAALGSGPKAPGALPTPIPGEVLVYFVPSDNDATATVLYLYNEDTVAHIVALRGFSYNGVLVYSLNINVGATSFLRLASDSVASAPPPSWATPAPIITNFTDFTYFASLSLPKGVRVEGYTLFNPGTGVEDPRHDQGAVPLRFSADPSTLFTPTPTVTQTPTPTATHTPTPTATHTPTPTATQTPPVPTTRPQPTPAKLFLPSVRNSP
jgi:cell division septation protein DedD